MRQALLIDLRGAMSAWGEASIGDNREVAPYPTASAVMGLLGAVCGVDRRDREGLQALYQSWELASLTLMERKSNRPQPLKAYDYQTAMESLKLNGKLADTVLGYKGFYQDAFSVAALVLRDSADQRWLEWSQKGFSNPVYTPCLGRISNPFSYPANPELMGFESSKALLERMRARMLQFESDGLRADFIFPQQMDRDGLDAMPARMMDRRMGWKKYYSDNDYWKVGIVLSEVMA